MLYDSRWQAAERSALSPDGEPRKELAGMRWKTTVELAGRRLGPSLRPDARDIWLHGRASCRGPR